MGNSYDVFDYCFINSRIHKLNLIYKIVSLVMVLIYLVISNSIMDMVVINFFIFVIMIWSDVRLKYYFRNLQCMKLVLFLVFFVFSLIFLDIFVGVVCCIKVIDFILYMSIIMMTTSLFDVVYGIEKGLMLFKRVINVRRVAIEIGICMKFTTILYSEWYRIKRVKRLRGVKFREMGIVDKLDYLVNGIGVVYRKAIDIVGDIRNCMMVMNYGIDGDRCNYRLNKWGKTDTILLVINVIVLIVICIY